MTQAFNLSQFANYLNSSGQVSQSGLQAGVGADFPSGTVVLFYQASAPTGWTQVTTQNNKALRVVSGTGGGTGGTTAFTTVFTNQTPTISGSFTVGATTLGTGEIPSHRHGFTYSPGNGGGSSNYLSIGGCSYLLSQSGSSASAPLSVDLAGGGGSHTHSISGSPSSSAITLNVQYIDIILASKN